MRRNDAARLTAALLVLVLVLAGVLGAVGAASAAVDDPGPAVEAPVPTAAPSADPSTAPTPVPTASPRPAPTTTAVPVPPAPSPEPTPVQPDPGPTPTPSSTPTPSAPATGQDDEGGTSDEPRRFSSPPAVTTSSTPWGQLLAALAVVVAGSVAVVALSTRRSHAAAAAAQAAPTGGDATDEAPGDAAAATPAEVLRLLVVAGEAMVDAGHTVSSVADTLEEIAVAHGAAGAETIVLPTALLVSVPDGDGVATAAVSTGRRPLLLHQVDDLADTLRDATTGAVPPGRTSARIAFLRAAAPPFGTMARLGGYLMLSVGLAALLGGSWVDLLVAGALGLAVGALQLAVGPMPSGVEVVLTVGAAFAVSVVVLLAARVVPELGVLPALVAPLVLFLPGGLLTTGVIELATGQMLSGGGRVAAGTMQLVLLAGGIVAAAALVGVPEVDLAGGAQALGPVAPWIGVVLFGVGTVVFRCGRPRTVGWVILVLGVAYGAQVVGDALVGGVLSAFVGALAMTPVALAVARFPSGPSPLASFLPAFWMLVPGALGLVGVTSLLEGDDSGLSTLVTTVATMVAIAFGVVLGMAATRALPGRGAGRRPGTVGGVPGVRPGPAPRGPADPTGPAARTEPADPPV